MPAAERHAQRVPTTLPSLRQEIAAISAHVDETGQPAEARAASQSHIYRAVAEAIPHPILIKGRDSTYLACNQPLAGLLGMSVQDVLGKSDADFWPAEEAARYRQEDEDVLATGCGITRERTWNVGGRMVSFEVFKTPLKDEQGDTVGIMCGFQDVSALRAEQEHRRRMQGDRDFTAAVLDMIEAPIIVWNSAGRIIVFNRRSRELFGYSDDDTIGHLIWDFLPPDGTDWMLDALEALARGEAYPYHEMAFKTRSGELVNLIWNNCILRDDNIGEAMFIGSGVDISELTRYEQAGERRHRDLRILYATLRAANSSLRVPEIYQKVAQALLEVGEYPVVSAAIRLGDEWDVCAKEGFTVDWPDMRATDGVNGRCIRTGEPQFVCEVAEDPDYRVVREDVTCQISVPVKLDGDVVGTLNIESTAERPLNEDDFHLMTALADQMRLVMANAVLHRNLEAERDHVSFANQRLISLQEIVTGISGQLDVDELLEAISCRAMELAGGTGSYVLMLNDDGRLDVRSVCGSVDRSELEATVSSFDRAIVDTILETGRPMLSDDAGADDRFDGHQVCWRGAISFVSMPLVVGKSVLGLLNVCHDTRKGAFDQETVQILSLLGNQAAVVLENAGLYAATAESKQRYRSLFDGNLEGIVLVDADTGQIVETNLAFQEMLGYTFSELKRRKIWDLQDPRRREEARQTWLDDVARGTARGTMVPFLSKRRRAVEAEFSSRVITLGNRTLEIRSIRDVTETIHLQERLSRAQKMEAVGTLASGIAHDFNNILGSILDYALDLKSSLDPDDARQNDLNVIAQSVRRGSDLTSQLLTFARGEPHHRGPVDLNSIVQEVLVLLDRTVDESIMLTFSLGKNLSAVMGDRSQLQQLVMNLCLNGCDAMSDGGVLTVRTQVVGLDPAKDMQEQDRPAGDYIQLSVSDTGQGMDEETMERMFEPFFSTKRAQASGPDHSGLGLATVFGVVQGHGGIIRAESTVGRGTTFRVWLPAGEGHEIEASEAETDLFHPSVSNDEPGGKGERILVVEDEDHVRELLCRVLVRDGYRVVEAGNGMDALERLREYAGQLELVILDMVMPQMSGMRTYLKMREIDPGVKVVIVSGNTERYQAEKMMEMGVKGYIRKPFTLKKVLSEVRKALDENR